MFRLSAHVFQLDPLGSLACGASIVKNLMLCQYICLTVTPHTSAAEFLIAARHDAMRTLTLDSPLAQLREILAEQ